MSKSPLKSLILFFLTWVLALNVMTACGSSPENEKLQADSSVEETSKPVQIIGTEEKEPAAPDNSPEDQTPAAPDNSSEVQAPAAPASSSEVQTPAAQESSSETQAPTGNYKIPALPPDEPYVDFPLDPDERINYIRALYYGFTQNKDSFESVASDGGVTGYWKKSTADLRLVTVDNETFSDQVLSAEYYFAQENDLYSLYFVFAHNADYSVEYRIYLWDNQVFRYIGPYESEETTYNIDPPAAFTDPSVSQLDSVLPDLISRGFRELHLYGYR